ncbi:hypothetical protein [Actinoplanes teichomyceticus]|uniref:Uncharacterized protein n=1 Tax=Actinoplanes teichomyceticus TaxID=1867 RepID=A0A561WAS2_ACTTI|nr:hypothetical protein [Actinoplanes teichomyceticus]TWG20966.1 hypothetical protein FHX34_103495 [Actinoplanes teichomyceticus]GIF14785.1 hypothetical protein Ate01nite_48170 [Actinoplanes teichomyceticus]
MAQLTAVSVTSAATTVTAAAVSASDTIAQADVGTNGALLIVINGGGGSITVTLSDPGKTALGNVGTTTPQTIPAGADRWFRVSPGHVDPSTGFATVTYSGTTSVTYKLVRA